MMKNKWQCYRVIQIAGEPNKTNLEQIGLHLLIAEKPVLYAWCKGFLISFIGTKEVFHHPEKREVVFITFIDHIEYLETDYYKFIELDRNTGEAKFTSRIDRDSDKLFFPISNISNDEIRATADKIREKENAKPR